MDERFKRIVNDLVAAGDASREKDAQEGEQRRLEEEFRLGWMRAYPAPDYGDGNKGKITHDDHRLVEVAECMKERFWDFHLGNFVGASFGANTEERYILAAIVLREACMGHRDEITEMFRQGSRFLPAMSVAHSDFFHMLEEKARHGLPHTPAMTAKALSRIAAVSYDKVRGDIRAGRWKCHPDDAVKNQQLRRWRHADDAVQSAILLRIREKRPEIIWSGIGWKN